MLNYGSWFGKDIVTAFYLNKMAKYGDRIHEYDSAELRIANSFLFQNATNFDIAPDDAGNSHIIPDDVDESRNWTVRQQLFLQRKKQAHDEYIKEHPMILKKTEGFQVASFRFPVLCSLSFTNQFRSGVQSQIRQMTGIEEKIDHDRLMKAYKLIVLAPVGYSLLTGQTPGNTFKTALRDPVTGEEYTYFQSMLLMPASLFLYRDLPILLFFWVKCRSKLNPKREIISFLDYPEDDLEFEIADKAPVTFPDDFKKLHTTHRTQLISVPPEISGGTNEKKCIREFICDPNAWKDRLLPCCEHILKYLKG